MPYTLTRAESDFFSPYFFSACADKGFCFSCIGVGFFFFFFTSPDFLFFLLFTPQNATNCSISCYK